MAKKSKIETSPHYNEIVDLLVAGYSPRYVSDYLSDEYNEKISHTSLNNYRRNNLNVKAAVKQKIIEEQKKEKRQQQEKVQKESKKKAKEASKKGIAKEAEKEIKANESFELAADYRFKDIKKLDKLIQDSENVNIDLDNINVDSEKYDPYKEIDLKLKLKRLGLDALKAKYEMLDEDELDVNINDNRPITSWDSLEQSRQKYLKEKKENK